MDWNNKDFWLQPSSFQTLTLEGTGLSWIKSKKLNLQKWAWLNVVTIADASQKSTSASNTFGRIKLCYNSMFKSLHSVFGSVWASFYTCSMATKQVSSSYRWGNCAGFEEISTCLFIYCATYLSAAVSHPSVLARVILEESLSNFGLPEYIPQHLHAFTTTPKAWGVPDLRFKPFLSSANATKLQLS